MKQTSRSKEQPVYKKAMEIVRITQAIIERMDRDKDVLGVRNAMFENACMLGAKIAGTEATNLYSVKMQNAVVIKMAACDLLAQTSICKEEELADPDFIDVFRDEIEDFRKLFVDWINDFDKKKDIDDGWGLF
ncbi:hypothetical protein R9C00_20525 [Flammeovirgaceae bacterium SG7u.111]|nr:hypothetical protein [Flammeovirgaceae bacterium SG7u.132]WPO34088.1 hypothetical protein R9C00_20525 [Flammeovirgaceae bacterium SG7u.111]